MALAGPLRGHALGVGPPEHWPWLALGAVRPQRAAPRSGRCLRHIGDSTYGPGLGLRLTHLHDSGNRPEVSNSRARLYLQFRNGTLLQRRGGLRNKIRRPVNLYTDTSDVSACASWLRRWKFGAPPSYVWSFSLPRCIPSIHDQVGAGCEGGSVGGQV